MKEGLRVVTAIWLFIKDANDSGQKFNRTKLPFSALPQIIYSTGNSLLQMTGGCHLNEISVISWFHNQRRVCNMNENIGLVIESRQRDLWRGWSPHPSPSRISGVVRHQNLSLKKKEHETGRTIRWLPKLDFTNSSTYYTQVFPKLVLEGPTYSGTDEWRTIGKVSFPTHTLQLLYVHMPVLTERDQSEQSIEGKKRWEEVV